MPSIPASPADLAFCPHDRGPGISVCLRCRADAHRKAAESRRRIAARVGIGVGSVLVLVIAANSAVASRGGFHAATPAAPERVTRTESFQVTQAGATEPAHRAASAIAADPAPTLAPAIDVGRTDLGAGRYAERDGDSITVHFDTPVFRTRRRDKFEQVVRATLPAVYGAYADSALSGVPAGDLALSGDLLNELPGRGVALPTRDGWTMTLWPATRPGHDGPLVVSYRISLARAK